jgi:hypothetical protein
MPSTILVSAIIAGIVCKKTYKNLARLQMPDA